jgi:hypothetical protein
MPSDSWGNSGREQVWEELLPTVVPTCTSKILCSHQTLPAPGLAGPCAPQDTPLYFSAPLT